MKKIDERLIANSCFNKADLQEMLFVLLGRDTAAPETIRFWVRERIRLGKNRENDPKITEALECADVMEQERGDDAQ